jgi:hypothetical protein
MNLTKILQTNRLVEPLNRLKIIIQKKYKTSNLRIKYIIVDLQAVFRTEFN